MVGICQENKSVSNNRGEAVTMKEARAWVEKLGNRWSDWCGFSNSSRANCYKGVIMYHEQIAPGHVEEVYWPCVCNIGWPTYGNTEEYREKFDKRDPK